MRTASEFRVFSNRPAEPPQSSVAASRAPSSVTRGACAEDEAESCGVLSDRIRRAQAGDDAALRALFAEIRPRCIAVALKVLRSRDDAEDAVQDAFLKVWRNLGRFEGRSSLTTWVHRIVMNASLDLLRRQTCRGGVAAATAEHDEERQSTPEAVDEMTPEVAMAVAERRVLVRRAVEGMSPVHREALSMREFEDCTYQEIARAVGCPIGTVMSRLHNARHRVASELRTMVSDELELRAA